MLDERQLEGLRTKTVELLLEHRAQYLGTPGANALKHWDLLQNRMLSAARRSSNPDEWDSLMARGLQLPAPSKGRCRALIDLGSTVREMGAAQEWARIVEREFGLLLAMARLASEQRREAKERGEAT